MLTVTHVIVTSIIKNGIRARIGLEFINLNSARESDFDTLRASNQFFRDQINPEQLKLYLSLEKFKVLICR